MDVKVFMFLDGILRISDHRINNPTRVKTNRNTSSISHLLPVRKYQERDLMLGESHRNEYNI